MKLVAYTVLLLAMGTAVVLGLGPEDPGPTEALSAAATDPLPEHGKGGGVSPAQPFIEAGAAAADRGKWRDAVELFAKAVDADDTNREALLGFAHAAAQAGYRDFSTRAADRLRAYLATPEGADDAGALIRLGRLIHATGGDGSAEYETAHERLDGILRRGGKGISDALFWKGHAYFDQALLYSRRPEKKDAARLLLMKAQGVLLAAARTRAEYFDALMLVARVSLHLEDRHAAIDAYTEASAARPDRVAPLRGLHRHLLGRNPKRYEGILKGLLAKDGRHLQALYFLGRYRAEEGNFEESRALLVEVTELDPRNADAFVSLGMLLELLGHHDEANAMFVKALHVDMDHTQAAERIDRQLRSKHKQRRAPWSPEAALTAAKRYEALLALAPDNPFVHYNVAYLLRKLWRRNKTNPAWRPVVKKCAEHLREACRIIGPWNEEWARVTWSDSYKTDRVRMADWKEDYAYAQILCDAGTLCEEAPDLESLGQAEAYYVRSLEFSGHAYYDGWLYLERLLERGARWEELGELAQRCATTLRGEDGTPYLPGRKAAAERLAQLVKDGLYKPGK